MPGGRQGAATPPPPPPPDYLRVIKSSSLSKKKSENCGWAPLGGKLEEKRKKCGMWGVRVMMVNIRKPRRRGHDHGSHLEEHSLRPWGVGATPPPAVKESNSQPHDGHSVGTHDRPPAAAAWAPGRDVRGCRVHVQGGGGRGRRPWTICVGAGLGAGVPSFDGAEDSDATRQPPPHQKDIGQKKHEGNRGDKATPKVPCGAVPSLAPREVSHTVHPAPTQAMTNATATPPPGKYARPPGNAAGPGQAQGNGSRTPPAGAASGLLLLRAHRPAGKGWEGRRRVPRILNPIHAD